MTAQARPPALEAVGIRAGYGGIDVLHGVDLTARFGEVTALLGPNGGGKSTLLRVVAGVLPPTAGQLRMAGVAVTGVSPHRLARNGVCLIPEGRGVFPNLTVRENMWLAAGRAARRAQFERVAYDRFPRLGERRTQLAGTLSGGEQQMLALARALATSPGLLLIDELSMGLAPMIVGELFAIVRQIAESGTAVVLVEQFAHAALAVADQVEVLVRGRVTRRGTPAEVEPHLASAYLAGGVS